MDNEKARNKELKKYLKELVVQVETHLDEIDRIMKLPESNKRGDTNYIIRFKF